MGRAEAREAPAPGAVAARPFTAQHVGAGRAAGAARHPPIEPRPPAAGDPSDAASRSPALQKLKQLKAKLTEELQEVERERQDAELGEQERIIPLSLEDEYRPRRGAKGKGQAEKAKTPEPRKKKDRDHEQWLEEQEKEQNYQRHRGQRLRCIIELRQESSKRREDRCENEIATLKRRLDATMVKNYDHKEMMGKLRELNTTIQSRVDQLQGDIEQHAEVEKMNIVRQCRVRMHELKKELEQEKTYTGATNKEWIDKNNLLEQELREAGTTLDLVQNSNEKLARENKELKVRFRQQEAERQGLVRQITQVRKENQRLDEQRACLEEEAVRLAQHLRDTAAARRSSTAPAPGAASTLPANSSDLVGGGARSADHETRYNEVIRQFKRKIEQERRTLQQVRTSHIELLRERTELELFLRQCVDDVRREIARNTVAGPGLSTGASQREGAQETRHDIALSDYSVADRKRLLELLLSKERVLNLLYGKTFPFKMPQATLADELDLELDPDGSPAVRNASAELDMDSLWAKWKAWTERNV